MDYTTDLNNLKAASDAQASTIAQATGVKAGLDAAIAIINAGYQSDQAAIDAAVAARVGTVQTQNATLTEQVATLTATLAPSDIIPTERQ